MAKDTLTVTDNRTGKTYELPVTDGTIRATDLRQIRTGADLVGSRLSACKVSREQLDAATLERAVAG